MRSKIKILDCTLRDGGYYNNWNFENSIVKNYINFINSSRVDIVELGFRFLNKSKYYGRYSFITDKDIRKLRVSNKKKIAIMINASDLISDQKEHLKIFLNKKKNSPVEFVRIAVHFHEVEKIIKFLNQIKKLGYKVIVNLMQASNKKETLFRDVINKIKKTKCVSVLYFADSLGCMKPEDIKIVTNILKKYWKKDIGFHAHDNMNLAFANTVQAIKQGVTWLDSTINGMGRGAGNLPTELLIPYYYKNKLNVYEHNSFNNITMLFKKKLKKKYNWGYSYYYLLGAQNNLHPTFIQSILAENKYDNNEIINIINSLKKFELSSFNKSFLKKIFEENENFANCDNAKNIFKNKKVLIVSQGNKEIKNIKKIIKFIRKNMPIVINLNINTLIPEKFVNYYIASNKNRIILDFPKYTKLKKKLIAPKKFLEKICNTSKINLFNYGVRYKKSKFDGYAKYCEIESKLVLAYALGFVKASGSKKIYLAGFDGYNEKKLNLQSQDVVRNFIKKNKEINIKSVTPTFLKFDEKI